MGATSAIEGGLSEPVFMAQTIFRAVMDAMARPGTIVPVGAFARPPRPMAATTGAVALTLCDGDTPVWLDPGLAAHPTAATWLGFHAGTPVTANPAEAHFALVASPATLIALENFAQGSQEYPDRSATLILQVETLTDGASLRLEGPGIDGWTSIAPAPLPRHFVEQWKQNNARFPRGVDIVLAAPDAVACLPRTTHVRPMGG